MGRVILAKGNMLGVFQAMLGSLGGVFRAVDVLRSEAPDPNPKKRRPEQKFGRYATAVSKRDYYRDSNGCLRRRVPKRDKSISARQWRKRRRLARVAAKASQAAA